MPDGGAGAATGSTRSPAPPRLWYLVDVDDHRVIVLNVGTGRPKATG